MKALFNVLNYTYDEVRDLSEKQINAAFRAADDSNKWPICNRFNATERAIRRLRNLRKQGMQLAAGYEYCVAMEREISEIVNNF